MRLDVFLIALAVTALLAGCGGGGDSATTGKAGNDSGGTTTTGSNATSTNSETNANSEAPNTNGDGGSGPLTKKAFIAQGDAICENVPKRYGVKLKALEKESKARGNSKPSIAEANLKAAVPPLFLAVEELEGLRPPTGDEQTAEAIVDSLEAAAKGLEEKPSAALTGPKSPFAEFQKLTKEYGFKVCNKL
jgi:hypothetical protein